MEYSNHCAVYGIRYFNVIFYLLAATEMDVYKINLLGEQIENGTFHKDEGYSYVVLKPKYTLQDYI